MRITKLTLLLATISCALLSVYTQEDFEPTVSGKKVTVASKEYTTSGEEADAAKFVADLKARKDTSMKVSAGDKVTVNFADEGTCVIEKEGDDLKAKFSGQQTLTPTELTAEKVVDTTDGVKYGDDEYKMAADQKESFKACTKKSDFYQKKFTITGGTKGTKAYKIGSNTVVVKVASGTAATVLVIPTKDVTNGSTWGETFKAVGLLLLFTGCGIVAGMFILSYVDPEGSEHGKANNFVMNTYNEVVGGEEEPVVIGDSEPVPATTGLPSPTPIHKPSEATVAGEAPEPEDASATALSVAGILCLLPFFL